MLQHLKDIMEPHIFGVCTYLGSKMGIATARIRLFFIYTSFLTAGSPVLIYLSMAFVLNLRNYVRSGRCSATSLRWDKF